MSDTLIARATVETVVNLYVTAEATITRACAQIFDSVEGLNQALGAQGLNAKLVFGRTRQGPCFDFGDMADSMDEMRRQLWRALVERLELRRMLSIVRAKELDQWLSETKEPITIETVMGLFRNYAESLPKMLSEAVGEVYDLLRPRNSKLKTNNPFELREKVILHGWIERSPFTRGYQPNYYRRDEFRALDNVFAALDGQGQISKSWQGELGDAVSASAEKEGHGETGYFKFRACKNGNLHIEFKRADLVTRFNQIAGSRQLKPGAREDRAEETAKREETAA